MDNLQKYKFEIETVRKLRAAARDCDHILAKVKPKYRRGREGQAKKAKVMLQDMANYVERNIGANPPTEGDRITHTQATIQRIRNAKEDLKAVFLTIEEDKQAQVKARYAYAIDHFNRFIDHLEYRIELERTWTP